MEAIAAVEKHGDAREAPCGGDASFKNEADIDFDAKWAVGETLCRLS